MNFFRKNTLSSFVAAAESSSPLLRQTQIRLPLPANTSKPKLSHPT
ncbi:9507_t:CDS:2 [Ambispora leptoticha]|uniref:9507_t:CDS:1 n=1 Tax=Ambispora leptoticha TaxID=144679 RepID=A0A9N8W4U3_9GLOM|nr:9507_t:CDS:2 [Ambispora leptoticha]